jgi:hypothetical protein
MQYITNFLNNIPTFEQNPIFYYKFCAFIIIAHILALLNIYIGLGFVFGLAFSKVI